MGKHSFDDRDLLTKKKGSRLLRVFVWSLVMGLIALTAGSLYLSNLYKQIAPEGTKVSMEDIYNTLVNPGQTVFAGREGINILCLGVDNNYTEKAILYTKGARSDTIFILHLDFPNRSLGVLSIPRDTRVLISESYGMDKINAAYAIGGPEQAKKTVQDFLGVPIDYYLILRVEGTKKLVDALGGVPVNVEKNMDYDDSWGNFHVHLKAGWQRLNGEQAVGYSRFRHDEEADRGRIRRQQQVVLAMAREMRKPVNLTRVDKIVKVFRQFVETDMRMIELFDLARVFKDFDRKKMKFAAINGDDAMIDGVSYIVPDEKSKEKLVSRVLKGVEIYEPADLRVEVLNGSGLQGLARIQADKLIAKGFQVVRVENADRSDYISTQIVDHTGSPQLALMVSDVVGPAQILQGEDEPDPQRKTDITVIVGRDKEAPPAPVQYPPVTP
jgi:LCP family protein required for cell wall assembly